MPSAAGEAYSDVIATYALTDKKVHRLTRWTIFFRNALRGLPLLGSVVENALVFVQHFVGLVDVG